MARGEIPLGGSNAGNPHGIRTQGPVKAIGEGHGLAAERIAAGNF